MKFRLEYVEEALLNQTVSAFRALVGYKPVIRLVKEELGLLAYIVPSQYADQFAGVVAIVEGQARNYVEVE